MTSADFEDPRELARCIRSDCGRYRLNKDIPFCAFHLREQEVGSPGIIEPDLEAKVARIRSEDDEHPGQKKVWHDDGTAEWVDDPDWEDPTKPVRDPELEDLRARMRSQQITAVPVSATTTGCWVAYHSDWSGLALFNDELEALRHAVGNAMTVGWAVWGQELGGGRYPSTPPEPPG